MKLSCATFNAADVMSIAINPQSRAGVWFLNWAIRSKKVRERHFPSSHVTSGSGLYGLCFDSKLIYIGSYLGKHKSNDDFFAGDVVEDRWWTHIGSITARGDCVHIAPKSLAALRQELGVNHAMTAGFLGAVDPSLLHVNAGNLAPLRRLLFAAAHQSVFFASDANAADILARFTFVYVRVDGMPLGMDSQRLSAHIKEAETGIIGRLSPCCNSQDLVPEAPQYDVNCADIEALLREALTRNLQLAEGAHQVGTPLTTPNEQETLHLPIPGDPIQENDVVGPPVNGPLVPNDAVDEVPSPEYTPTAFSKVTTATERIAPKLGDEDPRQLFWDRLPRDPHPSRVIVDSLVGLAIRLDVDVIYTKTNSGDIRFRTTTIRGAARIFMTLAWQPKLDCFIVQSQCSTAQAVVLMGQLNASESVEETHAKEPQLSRIKSLTKIFRITALREVFLQALNNVQQL